MKIAIVGFATEGQATGVYFARRGHEITVCDQNADVHVPEAYEKQLGEAYLNDLDRFDVIVRSAGIPPRVILGENPGVEAKITTAVNEFLAHCPTPNTIGITGTKGKGTTSTLTTKMLEAGGRKVWLGGNIGRSPLEFIDEIKPDDWVVLELSSYQLSDLRHSPHIAACLLVVPEHLDWHADMEDYTNAKKNLFRQQSENDIAIYYSENETSRDIAAVSTGTKLPYYTEPGAHIENDVLVMEGNAICSVHDFKLIGKHNWQNACAATTVAWVSGIKDKEVLRTALTSFSGLPHRIESVREADGVAYYNDSFATGVHATIAAVEAIARPKVLIIGGYDRMLPLAHFAKFIAGQPAETFRHVLVIGASGPRMGAELRKAGFDNFTVDTKSHTMDAVVAHARQFARPSDAVLLSPGFASFDMFKNFEERGNLFRDTVNAL